MRVNAAVTDGAKAEEAECEPSTLNVNDLKPGMTVVLYGRNYTFDHMEFGPRGDSRWLVMSNGYKTHRWSRESVKVLDTDTLSV